MEERELKEEKPKQKQKQEIEQEWKTKRNEGQDSGTVDDCLNVLFDIEAE